MVLRAGSHATGDHRTPSGPEGSSGRCSRSCAVSPPGLSHAAVTAFRPESTAGARTYFFFD